MLEVFIEVSMAKEDDTATGDELVRVKIKVKYFLLFYDEKVKKVSSRFFRFSYLNSIQGSPFLDGNWDSQIYEDEVLDTYTLLVIINM